LEWQVLNVAGCCREEFSGMGGYSDFHSAKNGDQHEKELRIIKTFMVATMIVSGFAATTYAQDEHRLTLNAGAGFTPLVGRIGKSLDNGWSVTAGGGYAFTSHFESNVQLSYSAFGVTHSILAAAKVPDGNSHLWSITFDPKIRLGRERTVDPYVVGGVGYYRRTIQFTPTAVPLTVFDPFFGFFSTLVPANGVPRTIRRTESVEVWVPVLM
jgi:hypothetical protein